MGIAAEGAVGAKPNLSLVVDSVEPDPPASAATFIAPQTEASSVQPEAARGEQAGSAPTKRAYPAPAELPTQEGPKGLRFDFNDGCRVLLPESEHPWRARLTDLDTGNVLFETEIKAGRINSSKRFYVRFRVEAWQNDELLFSHDCSTVDREVLIQFPVGTLGDSIGWFPYAVRFQEQHGCKLTCAMGAPIISLFRAAYPHIKFVTHEEVKPEQFYATYSLGLFFDDKECVHQPCDFRLVGLHRTAGYILGVDPTEFAPRIVLDDDSRPMAEPYVCIGVQSTTQAKYWNNPHGWREIVAFLRGAGYRVICIDQKPTHGHDLIWNHIPNGAEDQTGDKPLQERARWLRHADFFIGLSSGLSWLAWAAGTPVVMISGISHRTNEFATPYRVINYHTCNGCWNDPTHRFDHKDFLYCPRHKGTPRQFECTRLITVDHVKTIIQRIPGFGKVSARANGIASTTELVAAPPEDSPEDFEAHLRRAIEHLARGEAKKALQAASEACHCAPNEPKAHYAYGEAWLASNEPARAEQAFARAIQLTPEWADAWVNYGIARYRQGQVEDAKMAMRQALLRAPDHSAAAANLGAFMRITGESEGGEALLRATMAREPGNYAARLNLVADLLQQERAGDALAILDEAAPPQQDVGAARHWHLQHALALLQLGRAGDARAALEAFSSLGPCPPEIEPLWRWRLVLLAHAENDAQRAVQEAERMEAALAACPAATVPEHRIMAHFDLAKFWSGCGTHARSFQHWTKGHALIKPSQPFSRTAYAAFVNANIEVFDAARFTEPRARNRDPAPVFIVGMPRSGTTLCEQILAAHRDVYGAGERMALPRAFAALSGTRDQIAGIRQIANLEVASLDAAAERYLAELHALAPDKSHIIDKMPSNYRYLGLVGLMLPGAKIIYCARDPRDIGLSIFTFRFHGYHPYAHDLADLGFAIAQHTRLMDHWRAVLPNPILTVKLSDWVEDFEGTLARVLAHLDLPDDPACARFHERDSRVRTVSYAQVRQPINARGLGRWRAYASELAPLITELEIAGGLTGWDEPAPTKAIEAKRLSERESSLNTN